jgi:signal transduction histidine kinase
MIAAILQRSQLSLWAGTAVAVAVLAPIVLIFVFGFEPKPALVWATWWAAAATLLMSSTPVSGDLAPLILVMMIGCVGSIGGPLYAALSFGSSVALLAVVSAVGRVDDSALYIVCLALGWVVAYLLDVQARLLVQQRETQAQLADHAAADERRRIACEVHDVIAHALSATMLHVTAARRALSQDRDVDDAVDALTDAERLGRQATTDIRRTVGLLETGPASTGPEPGTADIPGLIDDFVQAGLTVNRRTDDRTEQVSAAVGLALYRITQESLANIAKHAADSETTVELTISRSAALLSVVNEMPVAVQGGSASQNGRGLAGMRHRVESLGGAVDAGPRDRGWLVRAEIPLTDNPSPRSGRCNR